MKHCLNFLRAHVRFRRPMLPLLFAIAFVVNPTKASAQLITYDYAGPAFNIAQCEVYNPSATCVPGEVTGSVTFSGVDGSFSGQVTGDELVTFNLSAAVFGQSYGATSCLNPGGTFFNITNGQIITWQYDIIGPDSTCAGPSIITAFLPGIGESDSAYMVTGGTEYYGFVQNTLGFWSNPKSLGKPCSHPGGVACGNPIDLASGNKYEEVNDYETAGQNKLSFIRYYNSAASPQTLAKTLGTHWRSNFDRYIQILSSSAVSVERPDGQVVPFWLVGSTWTTDTDVNLTLTHSGTTWTLK
jgi:hypothetical protein